VLVGPRRVISVMRAGQDYVFRLPGASAGLLTLAPVTAP